MTDGGRGMVEFLGVPADPGLLAEDLGGLPDAQSRPVPAAATKKHDRLVAVGSAMTAATLIGGAAAAIYGGAEAVFGSGGALSVVLVVIGILLVATHWGWVHMAEYVGLSIDQRHQRTDADRAQSWLSTVQPYPRFTVRTSVLADASTQVQRILYKPVLTERRTFSFVRETQGRETYDADTPAEVIAAAAEAMRRQARLETDRLREFWEAASTAYDAALFSAEDDQQRLAAQRAAAAALSEHINRSLLEPPLVE